jgi:amidase
VTALEIGSDIAGSLRVPAAFCGVYAHKATYGLLPKTGHVPPRPGTYSESDLSVVGPMARSSRDLALLLHVMSAGATPKVSPAMDIRTLKIGLWLDDPALILDVQVRSGLESFIADAQAAGLSITPIASPVNSEAMLETYNMLLMSQLAAGFPEHSRKKLARQRPGAFARRRMGAGPLSRSATILASTASHRDWLIANEARCRMGAEMARAFETYDVIVCPVAPVEPFFHDHSPFNHRKLVCSSGNYIPYNSMMMWVGLATICGLPATAIPAGFSAAGLPVGLQIIGPHGEDTRTIAVAQAFEQAVGGFVAPDL